MLAAALCLAVCGSVGAAPAAKAKGGQGKGEANAPKALMAPKGDNRILDYMKARLTDYETELRILRKYYESHFGDDLPTREEIFLSGVGIRGPRVRTITIERQFDPEPFPKPKNPDVRGRVLISKMFLTGSKLGGFAADAATSSLTEKPQSTKVSVPGSWICIGARGKLIPMDRKHTRDCRDLRWLFGDKITVRLAKGDRSGVIWNGHKSRLFFKKPGAYAVEAKTRLYAQWYRDSSGEWRAKATKYATRRANMTVYKATTLRISARTMVCFPELNPYGMIGRGLGELRFPVEYGLISQEGGAPRYFRVYKNRMRLIRAVVDEGDSFRLVCGNELKAIATGRLGVTKFHLEAGPPDRALYSPQYKLAACRGRIEIDPPPLRGYQLLPDKKYTVRLVVEGGANPKDFECRWTRLAFLKRRSRWARGSQRYHPAKVEGPWGKSAALKKKGKVLVAEAVIQAASKNMPKLTLEELKPKRRRKRVFVALDAEYLASRAKKWWRDMPGCRRVVEFLRPPLKSLTLCARVKGYGKYQKSPTQCDLFWSVSGAGYPPWVEARLELGFEDGSTLSEVEPEWLHCGMKIKGDASLVAGGSGKLYSRITFRAPPLKGTKLQIRAAMNSETADGLGVPVASKSEDILSDPLTLTMNRVMLIRREGKPRRYRLVVLGPATMKGYTAKWIIHKGIFFWRNRFQHSGFVSSGPGVAESRISVSSGVVGQVDIVAPNGQVMLSLMGDSQTDAAARIWIEAPGLARGDERVIVTAYVSGVAPALVPYVQCHWRITPNIGTFQPATSHLVRIAGGAQSSSVLTLNPKKALPGLRSQIEVKLILEK